MEARPSQLFEFFDGTKQLLIPLFQRPYEWSEKEWEILWDDILEQYMLPEDQALATHFTGAIVTAPARSVPVGVSKFLVIDGQQRLTTIAIMLSVIRSLYDKKSKQYRKITRLLINEDDEGLDYYKLLPTQPDRDAFMDMIHERAISGDKFAAAYNFFKDKIAGKDLDDVGIDLDRLSSTLQNRLTVVAIHLGETDDPYLIFESLNAKGAPLTQADLIRNYLLLRLHSNEQQAAYERSWLPMQSRLAGDHLTEFMRQYLMQSGEEVARSSIYAVLKKRLLSVKDPEIALELQNMEQSSTLYADIVGLSSSLPSEITGRLARLRRWDIATANPLILKLLLAHRKRSVSTAEVVEVLHLIESFAVRRTICAVPTNQLKRIFLAVTKEMPDTDVAAWLRRNLSAGQSGRRWPRDDEFRESLARYRAYAQPIDRCKFILETLEDAHGHKEGAKFEDATVEHIMPRTLSDEWKQVLGERYGDVHERWLDIIGNLTLTGYNPELSNASFLKKRDLLEGSKYELNKWVARKSTWTSKEIAERTDFLFEIAARIWVGPPN